MSQYQIILKLAPSIEPPDLRSLAPHRISVEVKSVERLFERVEDEPDLEALYAVTVTARSRDAVNEYVRVLARDPRFEFAEMPATRDFL